MSIPVGTKVKLLVPKGPHSEGTETFVLSGRDDWLDGYLGTVADVGRSVGKDLRYALDLQGHIGLPLLAAEYEVEVVE